MLSYKLKYNSNGEIDTTVIKILDGSVTFVPNNPDNRDRQEYQLWLNAGNEPEPADPPEGE